ncbi:MAG: membrane protein insertase YidC, partial [Lachnospiraceae bacterium]|nr:membrane protein insertase YidC [Lachnospiraceae bacterium]
MHIVIDALGYIMGWCYSLVGNYGLAIIFFTFISKIVLLPLSVWVQLNSIKMIRMQPEINMLKVQYYGDKDRIYEEQEKIYKRDKYNPFLSVIPLVVQIFILIGLVSVIYHPLTYILHLAENIIAELNMLAVRIKMLDPELSSIQLSVVDLVQSGACDKEILALGEKLGVDMAGVLSSINSLNMSFLGVNLSWVPVKTGGISLLVPLVAGLTSWLLCVAQNRSNVLQAEQSKFNQYSTMVLSVGISLYLGFFVPVGVVLYWIFSNLFAILQLYGLNFVINPRKYVDYEALELSRKKLEELELYGKEKKKGLFSKNIYAKREKEDYKRFFSIVNKHLVVYSEQSGYYKYFGDIVEYILKNTNITVHYVSSDPNDIAFEKAKEFKNLKPYYIGFNKFIVMAMKLDSDVVLMTMPDLDNFQIKRSYVRKDINYMYIAHGFGSRHLVMRTGAIDHFDTYFVEGKYQREEALKTEEKYGLNHKVIV